MPQRDVAIMELFYSSGLRLAELAALNVNDLDIYTESVGFSAKAARSGSVRSARRRWKRSRVTARRRMCTPARFS